MYGLSRCRATRGSAALNTAIGQDEAWVVGCSKVQKAPCSCLRLMVKILHDPIYTIVPSILMFWYMRSCRIHIIDSSICKGPYGFFSKLRVFFVVIGALIPGVYVGVPNFRKHITHVAAKCLTGAISSLWGPCIDIYTHHEATVTWSMEPPGVYWTDSAFKQL